MASEITVDLENSLPSWIFDHLGDCSFMEIEVKDYPTSTRKDPAKLSPYEASWAGETIMLACLEEVAFYKAAFQVGLRFSIYPTLRRILVFHNVYLTELSLNAWWSMVYALVFLKCFTISSTRMASSGGDNAEEKNVGDAPHVGANEDESCHSRDDSVEYVRTIRKRLRTGILSFLPNEMWLKITGAKIWPPSFVKLDSSSSSFKIWSNSRLPPKLRLDELTKLAKAAKTTPSIGDKGVHIDERLLKRTKMWQSWHIGQLGSGSRARGFGGLKTSSGGDARWTTRDFEKRVAKLVTNKECSDVALVRMEKDMANLKRTKENFDVVVEKLEKKVAELKRRENLSKKLAINEFKASKEYKKVVE
ncbi:hypothetical protein Acr_00g0056420 [Actinidia rufa]|uniref:Uncharacterized protein n=1 Tax=Actinidia rufa TaxID=165716 RepID=A0A7J0DNR1_9ERIC|nr:hypothetical protein Acr_00g0056420 [Actinidia rufa]